MSVKSVLEEYPDISFIENKTLEGLQKELIEDYLNKYTEVAGITPNLAEADPERLKLYAVSLQLYQLYQYVDLAGKRGFLKYSDGDFLENLGALKGISRADGNKANVMLKFTLSAIQNGVIAIPKGTIVTAGDDIYFYTSKTVTIEAGELEVTVNAECATTGTVGNGYAIGSINTIVKPIAFVNSVTNIEVSSGGAEEQNDDSLADEIFASPNGYSVAGPSGAYEYLVQSANSSITDVKVTSPAPTEVDIRFTVNDGELPGEALCQEIYNILSAKDKRPQTDKVSVSAPDIKEYSIDLSYYINASDSNKSATIQEEVNQAIKNYIVWQESKIGRDINPDELIARIIKAGAKRVVINAPVFSITEDIALPKLVSSTINFGGIEDD